MKELRRRIRVVEWILIVKGSESASTKNSKQVFWYEGITTVIILFLIFVSIRWLNSLVLGL